MPPLEIQIQLDPDGLSCDAGDAFLQGLAGAALSIGVEAWHESEASTPWFKRARELASRDLLPLPDHFLPAQQVDHLSRILGRDRLRISVRAPAFPDHLERAMIWFETQSQVPVAREVCHQPPVRRTRAAIPLSQPAVNGWHFSVQFEGQPHPRSEGEQRLFARLETDPELRGLFACNQPVMTKYDQKYWVDFLAHEFQCVVEVDGFHHHSSRLAFARDRHRDYQLLVSGYLTLRVDHDEVLRDLESVIGKIRDLIQFRQHEQR